MCGAEGEQGGLAPSPQLGEVMLRAWEGLGGVGGSAPPSAAGEQKDGTRGAKQRCFYVQNTGSAWQGSASGGAPTSHPVQGMTPPPRHIPHQELWVIFTISMPEKNPGTTTARRTGGTQPVALPTGALGVLPHLWVPEGLDSDSCSFFSPSCAPRGWCHLPRPYFPVGALGEAGLACGAACRGATSPGGVGRACVLRHGAWGRRDGGVCHLGLPTPQLLPWHC